MHHPSSGVNGCHRYDSKDKNHGYGKVGDKMHVKRCHCTEMVVIRNKVTKEVVDLEVRFD